MLFAMGCSVTDPYLKERTVVRILVVEDDPDVCDVLLRILRRAGHTVRSASNGADAVILAQEQRPDIILMDLVLPMMDGLVATRRLKADARTAHIPVLALTGRGLANDATLARGAGCDGFITKPFALEHLLAQVTAFAGRADGGGAGDPLLRSRTSEAG
jgi:two-component system cell cycle response regulator DivK